MVRALAPVADLTVLTRTPDLDEITSWCNDHVPPTDVEYVGVPGPAFGRRGSHRSLLHLALWRSYYLGWLHQAARVARRLDAQRPFDAVIHATLGIYWLPTPAVDLGIPSVWGPTSGAAASPSCLYHYLGVGGVLAEWAEVATAWVFAHTPWTVRTWRRATFRLVETASTLSRLPRSLRADTEIVSRAALSSVDTIPVRERRPFIVFLSRLERRKAPSLALDAVARAPEDVRLVFIHEGPQEDALRRQAERLGIAHRVDFRGKVPRAELLATLGECAGAVFTGLREEGGTALAEAMRGGVPVVVLGHGGARALAEANTDPDRVSLVEPSTPAETAQRIADAMTDYCHNLRHARDSFLATQGIVTAMQRVMLRAAATPRSSQHPSRPASDLSAPQRSTGDGGGARSPVIGGAPAEAASQPKLTGS
jgi:glycosyltransferase involved in cell wall biosynthesis